MNLLSLYRLVKPSFANTFHSRSIYLSAKHLALTTFKLSDIGEGINEVELLKWEKKVGDHVDEMESVCTVQSDKAAVEITSRYTGTVKKLYVNEGDTIKIGSPLMDIDTEEVEEVKLDMIGAAMSKSMVMSLQVPHVTIGEQADLTDLRKLYKSLRTDPAAGSGAGAGEEPLKVTITPFIIKALSLALEKVPIMNSKFNGNSYLLFKNHNISVAINTKHGLMVPNIKAVNRLSVREIQRELNRLQKKASEKALSLSDIKGGTCALSNLGPIGGTFINARLFDGQATIVAIGRAVDTAVPRPLAPGEAGDGPGFRLELRSLCNVGVTSDHRHLDGATIATFAGHFRSLLQDPEELMKHF